MRLLNILSGPIIGVIISTIANNLIVGIISASIISVLSAVFDVKKVEMNKI